MTLKRICFGNLFSYTRVPLAALLFSVAFLETSALDTEISGSTTGAEVTSIETSATVQQSRQFQGRHRLKMLFPLLLRISTKLSQVVPLALAAVGLTLAMALFAKKAFVFSVAAFAMMIYDTYKKKKNKEHVDEDTSYQFVLHNKHAIPHQHIPAIRQHLTYPYRQHTNIVPYGLRLYYNDGYDSDR